MQQQTLLIAILAVVAIGMCAQAVTLGVALRALRRLEIRLDRAERDLVALRPRLECLGQVIDHFADWTEGAATHLPRLAAAMEDALDQMRGIARLGAIFLVKPLRPLGAALALWQGLKSGANAYRQLRPAKAPLSQASLR